MSEAHTPPKNLKKAPFLIKKWVFFYFSFSTLDGFWESF